MRLEQLPTPGIVPNGQKLRVEVLKTINFITLVSSATGSTSHAQTVSDFLAAAKTEVDKFIVPVAP